jgi:hypothetical protein
MLYIEPFTFRAGAYILRILVHDFNFVKFSNLHWTYNDGLDRLSKIASPATPTGVLTLGAFTRNISRDMAARFLQSFTKVFDLADLLPVGLDACRTPERVS